MRLKFIKKFMDRVKNIFDRIGSLIPGYSGYADREGRRNCDKILRDSIVVKLIEIEKLFYSQMNEALKNKDKETTSLIEEMRKEVNTFVSKVKFAPYGATSFFGDNQIKEEELFTIYQFDFELGDTVNNLSKLSTSGDMSLIKDQINKCKNSLLDRNNYINEFK
jgi:hypothetical protein